MSTKPATLLPHIPDFDAQLIEAVDARDAHGEPLHATRRGVSSEYYELPYASDYVMRISRRELHDHPIDELLKKYSSLTPARHLMVGENIGQALLSSKDNVISVLRRQPGIPISEHIKNTLSAFGMQPNLPPVQCTQIRIKALTQVMRDIIGMTTIDGDNKPMIEHNPYVPLFEQAYALANLGYEPNFYNDAIFIDLAGKKLGLVNQLSHNTSRYRRADDVSVKKLLETQETRMLSDFRIECLPKDQDCADYQYSFWQFKELLSSARKKAIENHQAREWDIEHHQGQPDYTAPPPLLAFADVRDTSAVEIKSPAHVVMQRLRDLQASPVKTRDYF